MEIYSFESSIEDLEKERSFAIKRGDWDLAHKIQDAIKKLEIEMHISLRKKYNVPIS